VGGTAILAPACFEPDAELAAFLDGLDQEGAVVTFLGLARPRTKAGNAVTCLTLDHHPRLTQISMDEIVASAAERFDVTRLKVIHRFGAIEPGEPIVWVAAASAHRRAAFEAADYMMDRLKTDAVFWKREDSSEGSCWIEPTQADLAERKRWSL
jgi:molybdopterin synthase catalytic subunit